MHRLDQDEVTRVIPADPEGVFRLVADVTRTPEWSPQVVSCSWLDGATEATVGARFTAGNRLRWLRWSNSPVITDVEPGRRLAFSRTEHGGGTIEWSYRLQPAGGGTRVTLAYKVLEPVPVGLHVILRMLFGVKDLHDDLRQNMTISLQRIADIVATSRRPPEPPRFGGGADQAPRPPTHQDPISRQN